MLNNTENATASSSPQFTGQEIHPVARAVLSTLGSVLILIALTGNSLLVTFSVKYFLRKRLGYSLFVANLALADLLTMGYWFPFFVLDLILGYHPVVNSVHCVANGFIIGLLMSVSVTSVVTISLNRYLHVCHSQLYTRVFTLPRTVVCCVSIWILGLLVPLPPFFEATYIYNPSTHICSFNRAGFTYSKVIVIIFSTLPLIFVGYCNFAIFRFWKNARMSLTCRYPLTLPTGQPIRRSSKIERIIKLLRKSTSAVDIEHDKRPEPNRNSQNCADIKPEGSSDLGQKIDMSDRCSVCMSDNNNCSVTATGSTQDDDDHDAEREYCCEETTSWPSSLEFDSEEQTGKQSQSDTDTAITKTDFQPLGPVQTCSASPGQNMTGKARHKLSAPLSVTAQPEQRHAENEASLPEPEDSSSRSTSTTSKIKRRPSFFHSRSRGKKLGLSLAVQNLQRRLKKNRAREAAFVRSLFVISLIMFVVFIPYGLIIIVGSFVTVPTELIICGVMLLFVKNTVNWIAYGANNPAFRKKYARCLCPGHHGCWLVGRRKQQLRQ